MFLGRCVDGAKEGAMCVRDRACESKHCDFFRCAKRIAIKDGPCKKSAGLFDKMF